MKAEDYLQYLSCVRVQAEDFSVSEEMRCLTQERVDVGGVATFTGLVRDRNEGEDVATLTLEHYPGMTEKSLARIVGLACHRWPLLAVRVVHRYGRLQPGEQIVFVGVASAHRREAFAACEFVMDYLKTEAPFWKLEDTPEGERWVDAREMDADAVERWR